MPSIHRLSKVGRRLSLVLAAAAVMTAGAATPAAAASDLTGSTVTGTLFFPDLATILGGPASAVVGPGLEFPSGSIVGNSLFQIDVTGDSIIYRPLQTVTYAIGSLNGFVFDFVGAPTIHGVTLDPASNFSPFAISFTGNSVTLNLSGNSVGIDSVAILDIDAHGSAGVPEPAAWALMLVGFGGLGATLRRRRTAALAS